MKILIVDDSPVDRKILASFLKKAEMPHEVLIAKGGREGFDVLCAQYQDIGLVLLDWQMPQMDGLEFMRLSRKDAQLAGIPIIMITSAGNDEQREIAHLINPDLAGYIIKPFGQEELMEKIKLILN